MHAKSSTTVMVAFLLTFLLNWLPFAANFLSMLKTTEDEKESPLSCSANDDDEKGSCDMMSMTTTAPIRQIYTGQTRSHVDKTKNGDIVNERVVFVFLNDNPDAIFMYGDSPPEDEGQEKEETHFSVEHVPVVAGNLVSFEGNIHHHTVVKSGKVDLLGPFRVLSEATTILESVGSPPESLCNYHPTEDIFEPFDPYDNTAGHFIVNAEGIEFTFAPCNIRDASGNPVSPVIVNFLVATNLTAPQEGVIEVDGSCESTTDVTQLQDSQKLVFTPPDNGTYTLNWAIMGEGKYTSGINWSTDQKWSECPFPEPPTCEMADPCHYELEEEMDGSFFVGETFVSVCVRDDDTLHQKCYAESIVAGLGGGDPDPEDPVDRTIENCGCCPPADKLPAGIKGVKKGKKQGTCGNALDCRAAGARSKVSKKEAKFEMCINGESKYKKNFYNPKAGEVANCGPC